MGNNARLPRMFAASAVVITATAALAGTSPSIGRLSGVYKHSFANGNVDGQKYRSEDVVEIVKVSDTDAYVRAHLEFFNGHTCAIHGVAKEEGDALVYRPHQDYGEQCALTLRAANGKLVFSDPSGNCRVQYCGERGGFEGTAFPLTSRRTIRYMKVLLNSREYHEALAEAEKR